MFNLWTKIKLGLGIAGAFVVALGIAVLKGRAEGIKTLEAEQQRRRLDAMKDRKEVDDEVQNLGSNDVDQRFDRWLRDDKR